MTKQNENKKEKYATKKAVENSTAPKLSSQPINKSIFISFYTV